MADWIKVEVITPDKPEVLQIAERLKIDPDAAFGKCFRVWGWFDQHSYNGVTASVTKNALDRAVGVAGFCNAMIATGWMAESDGEIRMSNFDRHLSKGAKRRALTQKRVKQHRENGNKSVTQEGNSEALQPALQNAHQRREDKNNNPPPPPTIQHGISCNAPGVTGTAAAAEEVFDWEGTVAFLVENDVATAGKIADTARERGYSLAQFRAVVNEWSCQPQGRWTKPAGALKFRIENSPPGLDPGLGWPDGGQSSQAAPQRAESEQAFDKLTASAVIDAAGKDWTAFVRFVGDRLGSRYVAAIDALGGKDWLTSIPAHGEEREAAQAAFMREVLG